MVDFTVLWRDPVKNPINHKARSIPVLNPFNKYGRVFFFSWFGFFIAFWSWYAFPPLLTVTIKADLKLSTIDVANSNIAALCGTLVVRFIAGPLCDAFGPRITFVCILLAGSIPTAMAGLVTNVSGLIALRFFIGILGGSFVPCQVWSMGWFDRNIIGTSNALIGGWGNSGGGITYFVMPIIYDSLRLDRHMSPHKAWRVAFIVPFILIVVTAVGMLLTCQDTPIGRGRWAEREQDTQDLLDAHLGPRQQMAPMSDGSSSPAHEVELDRKSSDQKVELEAARSSIDIAHGSVNEIELSANQMLDVARGEVVRKPTTKEAMRVIFSPQAAFHCATYMCSFGGELAINSYIASYYLKNFPYLGQTHAGRWGSMFGLLNIITRPLGGVIADLLYVHVSKNLWIKKGWINFVGVVSGIFLVAIGKVNPHNESMMFGLIAGMAFFLEAGNGANFALVPHVHPHANGIFSGTIGAVGNLGGVIFAILFRYHGSDYATSFWIMGCMIIALNLSVCWIKPLPTGQIGGR